MDLLLEPGTLWERVVRQSRRSLESGDREPLSTELHEITDDGATFAVHVTAGRDRKWSTTRAQKAAGVDPFMPPYDDELFVADVGEQHVAVLNKFNVLEHHLLLVTRAFESQQSLLHEADFSALWACMQEFDALAFYNSAPEAGASQLHKHLQVVSTAVVGQELESVDLPFRGKSFVSGSGYAFAREKLPANLAAEPQRVGARLSDTYRGLLARLDLFSSDAPDAPDAPYNLLLTRDCMVVIPRTRAGWQRSGVNAIGYAGSFLLHHPEDLAWLREVGPLQVLAHAGRSVKVGA
jgi:ATP adenylyltransferase